MPRAKEDERNDRENIGDHLEEHHRGCLELSLKSYIQAIEKAKQEACPQNAHRAPAAEDHRSQRYKPTPHDYAVNVYGRIAQREKRATCSGKSPAYDAGDIFYAHDVDAKRLGGMRVLTD